MPLPPIASDKTKQTKVGLATMWVLQNFGLSGWALIRDGHLFEGGQLTDINTVHLISDKNRKARNYQDHTYFINVAVQLHDNLLQC